MDEPVKFATQIDKKVLAELKVYAEEADRSISGIVSEAVGVYLQMVRVRPAFRTAVEEVMAENDELLQRLAK
jgi:hypothetical protein